MVAVKANLVEIVGSQMSCRGRSCEEHELCGDEVLKEDVVVCLRMVQLVVDGKEEKAIEVVWVTEGMDRCRVGFLPCHMVRHPFATTERSRRLPAFSTGIRLTVAVLIAARIIYIMGTLRR